MINSLNIRAPFFLCSLIVSSSFLQAKDFATEAEKTTPSIEVQEKKINKQVEKDEIIEVCFVLDTTGSMSGLIEGAKRKIWSIANEIAQRKSTPTIRFSLIGYRDHGDAYITQVFDITDDLDAIHGELMKFSAGGGGDGPESVNQAMHEAITLVQWSKDPKVKKIVFLVGDAPPHMDYPQEVQYPASCELAMSKGIIINSIQCGSNSNCTPAWQKIAELGGGSYVALPQDGGVSIITAPQDQQIAELSKKIYASAISYGNVKQRDQAKWKKENALKLADEDRQGNASKNACQNVHGKGTLRAFSGNNDLVTEWGNKDVDLKSLKRDNLPKEFKTMSNEQLVAELTSRLKQRDTVQKQINKLQLERTTFIDKKSKELPIDKASKGFDTEVEKMLKSQLK